jgi:hypothetical protein
VWGPRGEERGMVGVVASGAEGKGGERGLGGKGRGRRISIVGHRS